jgi:phosphohistidine phosphatase
MKTLTLLRHAKSTWDDPVARDFDRPLNRRGRRAAHAVGREMRALEVQFDRVLASPAMRVRETLEEVARGYGGAFDPQFEQKIYLAAPETLLDLVHGSDDGVSKLLIVGHNPGLEGLALLLTSGGALRAELAEKYPTATLAEIGLPVERWSEVAEGAGELIRFVRPRDLDPELGPDEDS